MTCFGMFDHAAPAPYCGQRRGKAAAIIAFGLALGLPWGTSPVPSPTFAGWMCDDRIWSTIQPRVSAFVPRVYLGQAKIDSISLDIESGYHTTPLARSSLARAAITSAPSTRMCLSSAQLKHARRNSAQAWL